MADNVIELIVKAVDQASDQIGDIKETVDGLGESFKKLGPLAAAAIGAFSLDKMLDGIIESQKAEAQLNAAFAATSSTVQLTRTQLDGLTASFARNSTASGATVKSAEAILLTFDKVRGQAFEQTMQAAIDLSARMGTDLVSAVELLGRAVQNPLAGMTALGRAHIVLSQDQKDLITRFAAVGDIMGEQQVILAALKTSLQGAGDAAANTLGGALEQLKKAFGDLFELKTDETGGLIDSIKELKAEITDPEFVKGVQALSALFVNALGTLGKAATEAVQTIKGLKIIASGGLGDNELVNLDTQIRQLQEDLNNKKASSGFLAGIADPESQAQIVSMTTKLAAMQKQYDDLASQSGKALQKPGSTPIAPATPTSLESANAAALKSVHDLQIAQQNLAHAIGSSQTILQPWIDAYDQSLDQMNAATGTTTEKIQAKYQTLFDQLGELQRNGLDAYTANQREVQLIAAETADLQVDALKQITFAGDNSAEQLKAAFAGIDKDATATLNQIFGSSKMSEQAKKIVDTIQGSFEEMFLSLDKGVSGFLNVFLDAIKKIIAQVAAANLTTLLFGGSSVNSSGEKTTSTGILSNILGGVLGAFASGGTTSSDGLVRVGENGPENVLLPQGARVFNQQQWAYSGMGGGGGSVAFAPQYSIAITSDDSKQTKVDLMQYINYRAQQDKNDLYRTMQRNGLGRMR